jgi:hypothetical protein
MKRRDFRVSPLKEGQHYEALADRHLEYFFASKLNRQVLVKTRIVNRRNEIIDRDICKLFQHDGQRIANSFRLKKAHPKPSRYSSINARSNDPNSKTVGKKEFEEFLENQRNQIKNWALPSSQEKKNKTN